MDKLECSPEVAERFLDWIENRGGIAVWRSQNLANPSATWSTPATIRRGDCEGQTGDDIIPYPKPNWQCMDKPERIIIDPSDVVVVAAKEVNRLRVAVRAAGGNFLGIPLQLKCTDASSRRIRAAVEKAGAAHGSPAWFEFDYASQEAVVLVGGAKTPLLDFLGTAKNRVK